MSFLLTERARISQVSVCAIDAGTKRKHQQNDNDCLKYSLDEKLVYWSDHLRNAGVTIHTLIDGHECLPIMSSIYQIVCLSLSTYF